MHAEDLRDVALRCQDDFIEHVLAALVNNVTIFVDKVAASVNRATLPINEVAVLVLVEDGLGKWAHIEVTKDVVDVELCEEEDFRELAILEVLLLEDLLALAINNVTIGVDKISFVIYTAADVVN